MLSIGRWQALISNNLSVLFCYVFVVVSFLYNHPREVICCFVKSRITLAVVLILNIVELLSVEYVTVRTNV